MSDFTFQTFIDLPPKFILELASGMREGQDIAESYGYSVEQWVAMKEFEPLKKLVSEKKTELIASGWVFRTKCSWMAEDLLDSLYLRAKEKDISFSALLESIKFTSKAAGLDAPPKDEAGQGARVSISIDLGGGRRIDVGISSSGTEEKEIINIEEVEDILGEVPSYMASFAPSVIALHAECQL